MKSAASLLVLVGVVGSSQLVGAQGMPGSPPPAQGTGAPPGYYPPPPGGAPPPGYYGQPAPGAAPPAYSAPPPGYGYQPPPPAYETGGVPPAHVGFQLGIRTGYALPMGKATASGAGMSDLFSGQVPLFVEIGGKPSPNVFIGGYLGLGFGGSADKACDRSGVSC